MNRELYKKERHVKHFTTGGQQFLEQSRRAQETMAEFHKRLEAAGFEIIGDEVLAPEGIDANEMSRIWDELTGEKK